MEISGVDGYQSQLFSQVKTGDYDLDDLANQADIAISDFIEAAKKGPVQDKVWLKLAWAMDRLGVAMEDNLRKNPNPKNKEQLDQLNKYAEALKSGYLDLTPNHIVVKDWTGLYGLQDCLASLKFQN